MNSVIDLMINLLTLFSLLFLSTYLVSSFKTRPQIARQSFILCDKINYKNNEQPQFLYNRKKIVCVSAFLAVFGMTILPSLTPPIAHADLLTSPLKRVPNTVTPPDVIDILKNRMLELRSGVTGEKVGQLRVGESLFQRLRGIDQELDALQSDIFRDNIDWAVVSVYPKIFRAFAPLFTAYTDRAFPTNQPIDNALRLVLTSSSL